MFRFIIGEKRVRPESIAEFATNENGGLSDRIIRYHDSWKSCVEVFHVLGCGPTLEKAEAMAATADQAHMREARAA